MICVLALPVMFRFDPAKSFLIRLIKTKNLIRNINLLNT
jgi:P pilus assembly chaperone PapD